MRPIYSGNPFFDGYEQARREAAARIEQLEAALAKLVELKDLKQSAMTLCTTNVSASVPLMQRYHRERNDAWEAARDALARNRVNCAPQQTAVSGKSEGDA